MDWTAANAAMQGVRRYQDAFKQGRMDLVQKEADLYEQSMKTLESGTGIQSMRQTMDINKSTEERAAQMFPGKLAQQGATLESTEAGTAASQAATVAQEQQTRFIEEADREQKEALEIAKQILIDNDIDVTNPLVGKVLSDILSTATTAAELLAGLKENLPAMKIATAKKEIKAAGEKAETSAMKDRVEREVSEELRVGAIRSDLEAEAMKQDIAQTNIDYANKQIEGLIQQIEIGNLMKDVNKRYVESQINVNNLKAEASEANKIDIGNARKVLADSLAASGAMESGQAMIIAGSLPTPQQLETQIKFALDSKYRLADADINQVGIMMSKQGFGGKKPTNDAELAAVRKSMSEEFDKQIALLKYQLNLWGVDYSEPYDIQQATKGGSELDSAVDSIFGGE